MIIKGFKVVALSSLFALSNSISAMEEAFNDELQVGDIVDFQEIQDEQERSLNALMDQLGSGYNIEDIVAETKLMTCEKQTELMEDEKHGSFLQRRLHSIKKSLEVPGCKRKESPVDLKKSERKAKKNK